MQIKIRLGDMIDDYCPRCRLLLNHNVVSMVGEEVVKVRCRTCHNEHDYRHGKGGRKKKTELQSLFDQVLAKMPQPPPPPEPRKDLRPRTRPLRRKP